MEKKKYQLYIEYWKYKNPDSDETESDVFEFSCRDKTVDKARRGGNKLVFLEWTIAHIERNIGLRGRDILDIEVIDKEGNELLKLGRY